MRILFYLLVLLSLETCQVWGAICPTVQNYSLAVGPAYAALTPPQGDVWVQSNLAISCTTPLNSEDINGNLAGGTCACNYQACSNCFIWSGKGSFGSCAFNNTVAGGPAMIQSLSSNTSQPLYSAFMTAAPGTSSTNGANIHLYQSQLANPVNVIGARLGGVYMGGSVDTQNTLAIGAGVYAVTNQVWNSSYTGTDLSMCTTDPSTASSTCTEAFRVTGSGTIRLAQKTTTQVAAIASPSNSEIAFENDAQRFRPRINTTWLTFMTQMSCVGSWDIISTTWTSSTAMSTGQFSTSSFYQRILTTPASGNWMQFNTSTQATGSYVVAFGYIGSTSAGILTLTEQTSGTTLMSGIDMYATVTNTAPTVFTNIFHLNSPAQVVLRWTASTKNGASSNYQISLIGYIQLYKIA